MITATGGNDGNLSADQWAYMYQNSIGGSTISSALMDRTLNNLPAGVNRPDKISATDFINALFSGAQGGLSGIRSVHIGLGSFWA
jgi:hypothetical protein